MNNHDQAPRVAGDRWSAVFDWLPDVGALELSTLAVKEWLGLGVGAGWRKTEGRHRIRYG